MLLRMKRMDRAMNRLSINLVLCVGLLIPLVINAQENEVRADVTASLEQQDAYWVGQQLTINLDLKTTGFSFSNTHFNLPEVKNAFLMQTDTTTIKLSEQKEGQDWQIIRYPLALYPQQSGLLKIPPIDVRFSTSAGYGSTVKAFEFQTGPLELTVTLPPGVDEGEMVVSTPSFQLDHEWQGAPETAKTGDAFTLTVKRRASDISAMLMPALPVYETNGLAVYPQAPDVKDETERGSLVGERIDTNIWVAEKAGNYTIPGIRFQWWDPVQQELKQQVIPGIKLEIEPGPNDSPVADNDLKTEAPSDQPLAWLMLLMAVILSGMLWRRSAKAQDVEGLIDEKTAFATLQKACKNNQADKTHSALYAWIRLCSPLTGPNSQTTTLTGFARSIADKQLEKDVQHLQTMMIKNPDQWQGQSLLISLKRVRRNIHSQKTVQSKIHLAPLNP